MKIYWQRAAALLLGTAVGVCGSTGLAQDAAEADPAPAPQQAKTYDWSVMSGRVPAPGYHGVLAGPETHRGPLSELASHHSELTSHHTDWEHGAASGCDDCRELRFHPGGGWFGGAEYLQVRPTFSEANAYLRRDGAGTARTVDTLVDYDFDHDSAVRAFLGYRLLDCNSQVTFSFTSFDSDVARQSDAVPADQTTVFNGALETLADDPGQRIATEASVDLDVFDVDFSKTIPLGHPLPACQSGCGGCASWDVTWSAGIRMADAQWGTRTQVINGSEQMEQLAELEMNFDGAGPRLGLEGRRYLGDAGCWSLYARSYVSLLLGDYELVANRFEQEGSDPALFTDKVTSRTRVIPVTEIEVGATWRPTACATFSAGYLFQAWHDLGMSSEILGAEFGFYDDANILAFDGYFLRGEWSF
jgi:hypothetical protein